MSENKLYSINGITGFVCDTLSYALMLAVDYAPKVEKLTVEFLSYNCMSYKSESYKKPLLYQNY